MKRAHRILHLIIFSIILMMTDIGLTKDEVRGLLPSIQPQGSNDIYDENRNYKAELMISRSEKLAINQLKKLINNNKGTPQEVELWFRLAELYMRRAKSGRFFDLHRNRSGALVMANDKNQNSSARESLAEAVKIYAYIQNSFPKFTQMDTVIFNNAFACQQLGQLQESQRLFLKVLYQHPNSEWIPDSHLALAEMYYNSHKFDEALTHYIAIKKFPNVRIYPYSIYKTAWTYYNLHETDRAMAELENLVRMTPVSVPGERLAKGFELRSEALRDLALFFEDTKKAPDAFNYFNSLAESDEVGEAMITLAKIYQSHSRYREAQTFLNDYTLSMPGGKSVPMAYDMMVQNYETLKDRKHAFEVLGLYFESCKVNGVWTKQQNKEDIASAQTSFAATSLSMAKGWWELWKKAEKENVTDKKYQDLATYSLGAFEYYLQGEAKADAKVKARFAYADLLYQTKSYRKASEQYALVSLQVVRNKENDEMAHNADYSSIVALEKAVGDKWSNNDEEQLRKLSENYLQKNSNGKYFIDIQFKLALLDYDKGRLEKAKPALLALSQNMKYKEKALKAQDLYLDILNQEKKYTELKETAQNLEKKSTDESRKNLLGKIHIQAYFAEINALEKQGKIKEATKEYLVFAEKNSSDPLAAEALLQAIRLEYSSNHLRNGADLAQKFAIKYPTDKKSNDLLQEAARTYEELALLVPAAETLEKLAEKDQKQSAKWLTVAADFYFLEGKNNQALGLYQKLLKQGSPQNQASILAKLDEYYHDQNKEEKRVGIWQQMVHLGVEPQSAQAKLNLLQKLKDSGHNTEAFEQAKVLLRTSSKLPASIQAGARLIQAEVLDEEFQHQSVKAHANKIVQVISIKAEKLEKAQSAYQSVMTYGDFETQLKALVRLADCYTHFIDSLNQMPVPQGMNQDDFSALKQEIVALVKPIEDQRNQTINQASQLVSQVDLNDSKWTNYREKIERLNKNSGSKRSIASEKVNNVNVPPLWLPDMNGKM